MNNTNEYIGMWKFPNNEGMLSGTLIVDKNDSVSLHIAHTDIVQGMSDIEYEAVQGILSNGTKVTLFNVSKKENKFSFPGFPVSKYSCNLACMGGNYNSIHEISIKEAKVAYKNLNYWLNKRPFNFYPDRENLEITTQYKMPEIEKFEFENYSIEFIYKINTFTDGYSEVKLNQSECFKVNFYNEVSIEYLYSEIDILSNFLTLCFGKLVANTSIEILDNNNQKVNLIIPKGSNETETSINEHDLFIKYSFLGTEFQQCYLNWQNKYELLQPIIIYFVEAHDKIFHVPMSFLKIVQALEAFSRRLRNNKVWDEDEFKNLQDRLTAGVKEDDDKKFILDMLSNEPRLRQRLVELFNEVNDIFNISNKKRKSLINKIVNTRNYYTHFDKLLEGSILEASEMFFVSQYMKSVLRVILLRELNVNNDLIKVRTVESKDCNNFMSELGLI